MGDLSHTVYLYAGWYLTRLGVFYRGMSTPKGQVAREHTALTLAIAKQVKAERNAADLSQQELATRADMSITTLRRVESGDRPATVGQIDALAAALGVSLSTLIRRAEERTERADEPATPLAAEVADIELQLRLDREAAGERNEKVTGE